MADDLEEGYDDDAEDAGDGAKRRKLLLMVVLPALLVIGAVAGAYFSGLADLLFKEEETPSGGAKSADGESVQAAVFYDLPEMLVNLNTQGRQRSFLKLRVSLELASPQDTPIVESVMPRIVDNFQVYLRELRLEDLQGAAGLYRLREELLVRVSQAVRPATVKDVLFKDMLIQ